MRAFVGIVNVLEFIARVMKDNRDPRGGAEEELSTVSNSIFCVFLPCLCTSLRRLPFMGVILFDCFTD